MRFKSLAGKVDVSSFETTLPVAMTRRWPRQLVTRISEIQRVRAIMRNIIHSNADTVNHGINFITR